MLKSWNLILSDGGSGRGEEGKATFSLGSRRTKEREELAGVHSLHSL